ncbi:hypothetical protein SD457_16955 [Coprobacillaceae bacterium CR2/5/TPMF4]|nr:hypothetical protein SD457_16955 [Coprobacillaceae bacterium CR2/5/TPMF4]
MTLPRQLTFKDGKVYQYPIDETKALRKCKNDVKINNNQKSLAIVMFMSYIYR